MTPPGRPRGRGRRVEESPVAELAREAGVACIQPASVRDASLLELLRAAEAEVFLVVSYGELLRAEFLAIPREVCLNVHPSLLPRHRGASPIQAAILAGDRETGVSIQKVVLELDAGDVLSATRTEIRPGETAGDLAGRLAEISGDLVLDALRQVAAGTATYTPQDPGQVTFCKRLKKEDGLIDWSREAEHLERQVRAMNPWPGAYTLLPNGSKLAIWRAEVVAVDAGHEPGTLLSTKGRLTVACGAGALELVRVQTEGKQALAATDYLLGARLAAGERLGGPR